MDCPLVTVRRAAGSLALLLLSLLWFGCETSSSRRTTQYPPQQQPPTGQYAPPPQQPGAQPAPGEAAPPNASQPPGHAPVQDPINNVDIVWLRNRAQGVLVELVAGLDPGPKQRVTGIPLIVDDTVGEVNAFAACTASGKAAMAMSDGLLDIEAHLAQAKATDELFGSRKTQEYIQLVAANQKPNQPIVRPPLGFFQPNQHLDPRKVARQHELLDEQIAFVLGHEMAHHYLGHLPCTAASGPLNPGEIGMVLSGVIPAFNQPNEVAADMAGTNNVLNTGRNRQGYHWTEGGALLTMQFFAGMDQFSPMDIVFGFERSHPPPALRSPIVQQTANAWRASGGRSLPIP